MSAERTHGYVIRWPWGGEPRQFRYYSTELTPAVTTVEKARVTTLSGACQILHDLSNRTAEIVRVRRVEGGGQWETRAMAENERVVWASDASRGQYPPLAGVVIQVLVPSAPRWEIVEERELMKLNVTMGAPKQSEPMPFDEPREKLTHNMRDIWPEAADIFDHLVKYNDAGIVRAVLAEVARLEAGGDWVPVDDSLFSGAVNRAAKSVLEALRVSTEGV